MRGLWDMDRVLLVGGKILYIWNASKQRAKKGYEHDCVWTLMCDFEVGMILLERSCWLGTPSWARLSS
jgi:hypothetical protein